MALKRRYTYGAPLIHHIPVCGVRVRVCTERAQLLEGPETYALSTTSTSPFTAARLGSLSPMSSVSKCSSFDARASWPLHPPVVGPRQWPGQISTTECNARSSEFVTNRFGTVLPARLTQGLKPLPARRLSSQFRTVGKSGRATRKIFIGSQMTASGLFLLPVPARSTAGRAVDKDLRGLCDPIDATEARKTGSGWTVETIYSVLRDGIPEASAHDSACNRGQRSRRGCNELSQR